VIRSVSILLAYLSLHASAPAADTWHTNLETARKEEERKQAAELEGIRTNERMIQATIKARDFPAAVAVIDVIYKGVKPPQLALGTLNKAILSHRIDPKAMDRTWKLLQQALLEAEGEADLSKAVLEMARRISPARKLEKAKPEPKAKADKGA